MKRGLGKTLNELLILERALFVGAAAFLIFIIYKFGFNPQPFNKTTYLEKLRSGTFLVKVGERGRATAANIGNNFALTAGHVCDQEATSDLKLETVTGEVLSVDGYISTLEQERDLCVLHIIEPVNKNLFVFNISAKDTETISKNVYIPGFAGGRFYSLRYGLINGEYTVPIALDPFGMFVALYKTQMVAIPMEPGGSGGAVLLENGQLVGIVSATDGKTTMIMPLVSVREFLEGARKTFPNLPEF